MLREYLTPLSGHFDFKDAREFGNIGGMIQAHTIDSFPVIQADTGIIIIGVPEGRCAIDNDEGTTPAPNAIRQALYTLFPGNWHLSMVDLGDLKLGPSVKDTYDNLGKVLSFLPVDSAVIVLGGSQDLTLGLIKYYDLNNKVYNLNVIDAFIDGSLTDYTIDNYNFLSEILRNNETRLQNISILGIQSYYNHPEKYKDFEQLYVDIYNLGDLKADINEAEPELRNAHIVSLDVKSLRFANMPAQKTGMPNGFDGIEICKLARMSGMGPLNKIFGVFEYNPLLDNRLTGAHMIAQVLWYYIEGKNKRQKDYPEIPESDLIKFHVENDMLKLIFYKNPFSGRWWVEIPQLTGENSLIPCSENDYNSAVKSIITKRIHGIINKITI